jgi:hypothetical protein
MRLRAISASLVLLSCALGCAGTKPPPEPVKAPETTLTSADYVPHDDMEMSFAPEGVKQGPAIKHTEPTEGTIAPRVVSTTDKLKH